MKLAFDHIISNLAPKPNINDLSDKLFQLGHEHEVEKEIFDMEITPNRGDCLSVIGLQRDLNQFYEFQNNYRIYEDSIKKFNFNFINNAKNECPKISFLKIEIDEIPSSYNEQLDSYFSCLGLNKNNFFTDVSNYISYETGQPVHCYESKEISNGISLEMINKETKFESLLNTTIKLKDKNLVFVNKSNEIVNLAGIIGGERSSCSLNTKSVIVECAYFKPESIIGKALKYNISSEAAHKFERHVDPNCHDFVLRRFINIVEEHAKILNIEIFSEDYTSSNNNKITDFSHNKINKILGTSISEHNCIDYLKKFGFIVNRNIVTIPSYRNDIYNQNDLAEELARAIGYDNIKPLQRDFRNINFKKILPNNEINLKNLLIDNGFSEVINDSFAGDGGKSAISIDNPLDVNKKFLRTSLKHSLLDNLIYNERRQKDSIKLFEIADIYSNQSKHPKKNIGIIISGRVDKNYQDFNKKLDSKYLSNLLKYHIDDNLLNYEIISRNDENPKFQNKIIYLEIELSSNFHCNYQTKNTKHKNLDITYSPVSDFPSSKRDLSFSLKNFSKCKYLEDYLLSYENSLLKEVFVFDFFYNSKKEEIKIGFRFIFQSSATTIKEEQVNKVIDDIIQKTYKIDGVSIPGLK